MGALSQGGGIQVSGVTDLALTASDKPEETVYLRGFIGGSYDGTTWQAPDADAFDSAAMNWKTEDNARLTIASLPFLRTAYDGHRPAPDADGGAHPRRYPVHLCTVQRLLG